MRTLVERFRYTVVGWVIQDVQVGGHCGCCGAWVDRVLVDIGWPWTLCAKCIADAARAKLREADDADA